MRILASEVMGSACHQVTSRITLEAPPPGESFAATLNQVSSTPPMEEILALLRDLIQRLRERLLEGTPFPLNTPPIQATRTMEEHTDVRIHGAVQTADGRNLGFAMDLHLRQEQVQTSISAALQDPLVLAYDGPSARLEGKRWNFDLDADGKQESLPGLAANSGLLVFDKDGDQLADDGRELFGATSGNGFQDLKGLDSDGNGWIDEGDPAFKQLKLWNPGEGKVLHSLQEKGIGALWTGSFASPFDLGQGQLRSTGLYLREKGGAGALQQVDFRIT